MQPQYNNSDYSGRTTTAMTSVKNYPWYDGIKREPNNADGTMGDIIYEADGVTPQTIPENWYNNSVKTDANGNILTDEDGNPIRYIEDGADMQIEVEVDGPDGVPDNPGQVVWEKPIRTEMTANNNFNLGLSATLSIPLDNKLQNLCKKAAQTQIDQQLQLTANKRLDFEIARLKNCGELMKQGIIFHPRSKYAAICADVVIIPQAGKLLPHTHEFPRPTFSEDTNTNEEVQETQANGTAENLGTFSIGTPISPEASVQPEQPQSNPVASTSVPEQIESSPSSSKPSFLQRLWPFSQQASPPLKEDQPEALLGGPIQLPPSQSLP